MAARSQGDEVTDQAHGFIADLGIRQQTNHHQAGGSNNTQYNAGVMNIHQPPAQPKDAPRPDSCTLPFSRDPDFVDRPLVIGTLASKLSRPSSRVALVGLGGVGKSQIAIEHCYRVREQSPETWVFWLHASTASRFDQNIRDMAELLEIYHAAGGDKIENVYKAVLAWLREPRHGSRLIVVDNADEASFLLEPPGTENTSACNHRMDFLPRSQHVSILLTTRSNIEARKLVRDSYILPVLPMDEEAAKLLLDKKLPASGQGDKFAELARALDYMPLAITQAAAYIRQRSPRLSVSQYLSKLRRDEKSALKLLAADVGDLGRDHEAQHAILLTWQISFRHIQEMRASAADLLSIMSFFDHQGIPEILVRPQDNEGDIISTSPSEESGDQESVVSRDEGLEQDIQMLRDYSFIAVHPDGLTFEMHHLVQLSTRKWLQMQGEHRRWAARFVQRLDSVFPKGHYETWPVYRLLYPHIKLAMALDQVERDAILSRAALAYRAARYQGEQGAYTDAQELLELCLSAREELLGKDDDATLVSMNDLGVALLDQGKYETAEHVFREALERMEKIRRVEHPGTLMLVDNIAVVLRKQQRYEEAEKMHRRAHEGRKNVLGKEHPFTLKSASNLSVVLHEQGRHQEAEEMQRRVLEEREKMYGEQHPDTLMSSSHLAGIFRKQGRYEEAEEMERRVLEGREKVLGEEHPDTLMTVNNLGTVLMEAGDYEGALTHYELAFAGRAKFLGDHHPQTLITLHNLATALAEVGHYQSAVVHSERAVAALSKVLGADHPDTLLSLTGLAWAFTKTKDYERARPLYQQAFAGRSKALGVEHPLTLNTLHSLAWTLSASGDYASALPLCERAFAGRSKVLGDEHPQTVHSGEMLSSVRGKLGLL